MRRRRAADGPVITSYSIHYTKLYDDPPARAAQVAQQTGRSLLIWAGKAPPDLPTLRVEDGFLRSRGLGADLIPPLSLVTDAQRNNFV